MSYRVLVLEGITDRGLEILRAEGWTIDHQKALSPAELAKIVAPYHAILIRSGSQITAEVLDAAKSLKVIGRPGVGVLRGVCGRPVSHEGWHALVHRPLSLGS